MRAPITDKHLLEMMWERFPEIMKRGIEQPAQQEPVAWVCEGSEPDEKHGIDYWPGDVDDLPIGTQLYTSPPTLSLAQRKPLTDEEIEALLPEPDGTAEVDSVRVLVAPGIYGTEYTEADAWTKESIIQVARAIEAAHGIKENT